MAWGALAALTVNFFSMAELSLSVAGMTWLSFWQAHLPAVRLTVASFPIVWVTATALRGLSMPPLVVLSIAACTGAVTMLTLCRRAPAAFLGPDALWMLRTLRGFTPQRHMAGPLARRPVYQGTEVAGAR